MPLSNKLLDQGYVKERLKSSLRKFYGRYGDLIKQYEVPLSRMLNDIGLKLNGKKCKTMRTDFIRNDDKIIVNNETMEDVSEFIYLGAMVDKEGGEDRGVTNRLQKTRVASYRLKKI